MTTVLEPEVDSDPYLISLVRGGNTDAFGRLYERHVSAARRLARVLAREQSDADDLVAEAFARVLAAMLAGRGPDTAFRAYLLTTLRHVLYDRGKRDRRVEYTDDLTAYERPDPPDDPVLAKLESSYAARAFARLPERWRAVLWHTEVEGESAAEVAPLLGLTPNGVAALAYRARERLRQMYLQEHIVATGSPRCHWTGEHLGGYVRANLARRDRSKVEDHLAECAACRALHRELSEENSGLRGVIAALLLGSAAPGYLTVAGHATGGWIASLLAGVAVAWHTVLAWPGRALNWCIALWAKVFAGLWGQPRRTIERYGPGNVAAAAGLIVASLLGIGVFAGVLVRNNDRPQQTDALAPLPAPAQVITPMPPATAPPQLTPPTIVYAPPSLAPLQTTTSPPAPTPVVAPDVSDAQLAAGESGTLPIAVRVPESSVKSAAKSAMSLTAQLPSGVTLAGTDAGDDWTCAQDQQNVSCQRPTLVHNGQTVARLRLAVAPEVTGYQPFKVSVRAGAKGSTATLRAPIAPAGMRVAYSARGRLGFATGGNALVTCQPRPECLPGDNNVQAMLPWLPMAGEPVPPKGLPAEMAASAARIALPAGARVRWARLSLASSGEAVPQNVLLAGPGGRWYSAKDGEALGELLQREGGGDWWVAAKPADLPAGLGQFAGWSITAVYDDASASAGELAVYAGPRLVHVGESVTVQLGTAGKVDLGLVVWDGDRSLTGDTLEVAGQPLGDPTNVAAGATAPGLDLLRDKASVPANGSATLSAGDDPLQLATVTVLTETGQPAGRSGHGE